MMASKGQVVDRQNSGDDQGREGTDHVDFAMGKIDQADDTVDHGVAERNKGIDRTAGQAAEKSSMK